MKIGVIIPDRGDRPEFLQNCLLQLKKQTFQPETIELVDFKPENNQTDITKRYRIGYDNLRNKGLDLISFIENDDCYNPNYLEWMVGEWIKSGKTDLFGTNKTYYYNIRLFKWFTMEHYSRSSMMNTFIRPDLTFIWCSDDQVYTDMHLWDNCKDLSKCIVTPDPLLSLGIKHGVGLCGGFSHTNKLDLYDSRRSGNDSSKGLLKSIACSESFEFYSTYFQNK